MRGALFPVKIEEALRQVGRDVELLREGLSLYVLWLSLTARPTAFICHVNPPTSVDRQMPDAIAFLYAPNGWNV